MPTLHLSGIQDIVNTTLRELGRDRIQQIAQSYVNYPVCNYFFRRKGKVVLDDGYEIQRTVWIKKVNVAESTALWEADTINVENLTTVARIPWRYYKSHWAMDAREVDVNAGPSRIYEMIKVRKANSHLSMVELLNAHLWTLPGSTNERDLYGIPYYLVKNATTGFNGGHPSGYTSVANISRTTYSGWKNYTAQYVSVSKADVITKLRTAFRACRFMDIEGLSVEDYRKGARDNYVLFVNNATMAAFENVGESQNENLGKDVASIEGGNDIFRFDGGLTFRRKPIVFEPYLDTDTTNPVYFMDLSTWCMYVRRGFNMKQSEPEKIADNHNAVAVWQDLSCNLMCVDPRRNGVMYV